MISHPATGARCASRSDNGNWRGDGIFPTRELLAAAPDQWVSNRLNSPSVFSSIDA
jgi:hypothetical protein